MEPLPEITEETIASPPPQEDREARFKRLLSQVRETRMKARFQASQVKGRPDRTYIWVRNDPHTMIDYKALGYEVVRNDPGVKTQWPQEDGTHVRGDVILMQIDRELREVMDYESDLRATEGLSGSREAFKEFAYKSNIPVQDTSRHEVVNT